MTASLDLTRRLYDRWNDHGIAALAPHVDPAVRLVCDPLHPEEHLDGLEGWHAWAARWDATYSDVDIVADALVPLGEHEVLALVSISATPAAGGERLTWAGAHVWRFREHRVSHWQAHLDLEAARATLDA